jgi:hypothetical protein
VRPRQTQADPLAVINAHVTGAQSELTQRSHGDFSREEQHGRCSDADVRTAGFALW